MGGSKHNCVDLQFCSFCVFRRYILQYGTIDLFFILAVYFCYGCNILLGNFVTVAYKNC